MNLTLPNVISIYHFRNRKLCNVFGGIFKTWIWNFLLNGDFTWSFGRLVYGFLNDTRRDTVRVFIHRARKRPKTTRVDLMLDMPGLIFLQSYKSG